MSQSELERTSPVTAPTDLDPTVVDDGGVSDEPDEVLSLLSDDYARAILTALVGNTLPARELVDRIDASRATVYRRLQRLEAAGLTDSSVAIHPDGHHRREFSLAHDRLVLSLDRGGVDLREHA
jgi:DNA-binding transcriptional ArsR family regulator